MLPLHGMAFFHAHVNLRGVIELYKHFWLRCLIELSGRWEHLIVCFKFDRELENICSDNKSNVS